MAFYNDTPEDVQRCLNCEKPKCNNCLGNKTPPSSKPDRRGRKGRAVEQIDPTTGEVLARYQSFEEAGRAVEVKPHTIGQVCKGVPGHHTAAGYKWRFADDKEKKT